MRTNESAFAVLNGNGEQIVNSQPQYWDQLEAERFADAAGLRFDLIQASTWEEVRVLPPKRRDCVRPDWNLGWFDLGLLLGILAPVVTAFLVGWQGLLLIPLFVIALMVRSWWTARRASKR